MTRVGTNFWLCDIVERVTLLDVWHCWTTHKSPWLELKALFPAVLAIATKQSNCLSKLVAIEITKDSLYNDEDLQADTVELEEASLTEESRADEAESVKESLGGSANDRALFSVEYWRIFLCSAKDHRGWWGWLVMATLSLGLFPNHMQCTPGNKDESLIWMILY